MSTTSNEKLSSLVDDELDAQQSLRTLEKLRVDPELADKYQRYQLIGELMKQNRAIHIPNDFVSTIHDRLKDEPIYLQKTQTRVRERQIQWQNAAMASAACLLLATLWFMPHNDKSMQAGNTSLARSTQSTELASAKLNEYLQAHDNAMYAGQMDNNRRREVRVVRY